VTQWRRQNLFGEFGGGGGGLNNILRLQTHTAFLTAKMHNINMSISASFVFTSAFRGEGGWGGALASLSPSLPIRRWPDLYRVDKA